MALALLGLAWLAAKVPAQDKLVFAVDIIRHGDRTPLTNLLGENPTNWPEGFGNLTALGTNQEYALGAALRGRFYGGLLDSNTAPESIRAFSTDMDRTRQSARFFLSGLVGGIAQSIPILTNIPVDVTAGLSKDNGISTAKVLIPEKTANFPALETRYVLDAPEWVATNGALRPQFARWGGALNRKIVSVQDLIGLGDSLYIHQIHHVPLPAGLGPEDVEAVIAAGRWAFVYEYNPDIGRFTGKALLGKIAEYIGNARREEASQRKTVLKYVLFSAHDNTLLSEMSALRAPLTGTNSPPYASFLHFALFEGGGRDFHIQVLYHDHEDHLVPDPENGGAAWSVEHLLKLAGQ
jgi:acid phosphatase